MKAFFQIAGLTIAGLVVGLLLGLFGATVISPPADSNSTTQGLSNFIYLVTPLAGGTLGCLWGIYLAVKDVGPDQ